MQFSIYENLTASVGKTTEDIKMFLIVFKMEPENSYFQQKDLNQNFHRKNATVLPPSRKLIPDHDKGILLLLSLLQTVKKTTTENVNFNQETHFPSLDYSQTEELLEAISAS